MKKIRVITYHRAVNFGAVLQAQGLINHLQKQFPEDDVKILDYRSANLEARNFLKIFKLNSKKPFYKLRRYRNFRQYVPNNIPLDSEVNFSNKYDRIVEQINKQNYDLLITGSDSIWKLSDNPLLPPFPNIYWLSEKISSKKISYAASAYQCNLDSFKKYKKRIKKIIESYDLVAVRDEFTQNLIKSLETDKQIYKIPDPAFYYQIEESGAKEKLKNLGINPDKPIFALVTGSTDSKIEKIVNYFRKKDFQIVSLSMFNRLVDYNLGDELMPNQWAEVYKYIDFTLTDRFHGAIFCIKNKAPFIAIETKGVSKKGSKKYQLIKDFDLKNSYLDLYQPKYRFTQFKKQHYWLENNWSRYEQNIDSEMRNVHETNKSYTEKVKELIK
jgi:polysaccharide pyruvyl transferase WcaK-like protein